MSALRRSGVEVIHFDRWSSAPDASDLLILGQTVPLDCLVGDQKVLGLRTLNRRTRLDVLAQAGLPVQDYGTPNSTADLATLCRNWNSDAAVVKLDWSFRRAGIALLPVGAPLPLEFDPSCDVAMRPLDGDPRTLKIDIFADQVLGATWLDTRAITAANWQMIGPRGQWTAKLTPEVEQMVVVAGRAMLPHGVGYASIDVMFSDTGPRIIEANTTSVGTAYWRSAPQPYADALARGVLAVLDRLEDLPTATALAPAANTSRNAAEAVAPDRVAGHFTPPRDMAAILESMMHEADLMPEAARAQQAAAVEAELLDHARANVPAYRAAPASNLDSVVSLAEYDARRLDFTARDWPERHGMVAPAVAIPASVSSLPAPNAHRAPGADGQQTLTLTLASQQTRFAAQVDAAVRRRALLWAGATLPKRELVLIDRANASQAGLGCDSPPVDIWAALADMPDLTLWTTVRTALALAQSVAPSGAQRQPDMSDSTGRTGRIVRPASGSLRGIVLSGPLSTRQERETIARTLGVPVAEVMHLGPAGCVAIRCPEHGMFHTLTDVARLEPEAATGSAAPLIVTAFYNLAQPVIRLRTAARGFAVVSPPGCSCPARPGPVIALSNHRTPAPAA
ncbi:hypothetical protein [Sagittula salina]|uniref:ATP-grasp domain-containing protein n=1 Tax=Sagittula salina TaxID=2820268 RepID=A0A940MPC9_9RHOB|nr:hypothetical protein [Sagittula salina]MBP0485171.1 hypothetical protein [Sagittula salina]